MEHVSDSFSIDLRRLGVLRELRTRGTIAAVAEALHLTPSAVSQQIARMSRELGGVPLVSRHGRRVRLTSQAELLLDHAALINRQLEQARAELAAHEDGQVARVSVGAFASAIVGLVAPALAELATHRPGVAVTVHEAEPPDCFIQLENGDLDIVVTVAHEAAPSSTDPRFDRTDLLFDPLMLAVPAGHRLAGRSIVDLELCAEESWVLGTHDGPCSDAGVAACAMAGFSPGVRHRVDEWSAVLALVAAGGGVALVPRLGIGSPPMGVVLLPLASPRAGRALYALLRGGAGHNAGYRAVLDALRSRARSLRAVAYLDDIGSAMDGIIAGTGVSQL